MLNPAPPTGPPPPRRISYHGSCPQGLADSAWIPFREHCYSFHMELLLGHKEALQRCQRGGPAQARAHVVVSGGDPYRGHLKTPGTQAPCYPPPVGSTHTDVPHQFPVHRGHVWPHVSNPGRPHTEAHSTPTSTQAAGEGASLGEGVSAPPGRPLSVLMWASLVSSGWGGPVHSG